MPQYYLLLDSAPDEGNAPAQVCGTYRRGVDSPAVLESAAAYIAVDHDEWRLAREPGEWRFTPERGIYAA